MAPETFFDYYYGDESTQFSFYRIPQKLITGKHFKHISVEAKLSPNETLPISPSESTPASLDEPTYFVLDLGSSFNQVRVSIRVK